VIEPDSYFTTVVFADVAGSSKLYKQAGDDEANQQIGAVVEKLVLATKECGGVVVKTIGDEVMCHFSDVNDACTATVLFQDICDSMLPIRVGMACGTVIEKDGDLFGQAVNDAAAVAKIAKGGQIITTEAFNELLSAENSSKLSVFDEVRLKGAEDTTKLYRIDWDTEGGSGADHTVIMSTGNLRVGKLILSYKDNAGDPENVTLTPEDTPFHIGRSSACQLSLATSLASRDHCHIEYRYGKFILIDHSTNGTYLESAVGGDIYLRREEMPLQGSGEISLGEKLSDGAQFTIEYYQL